MKIGIPAILLIALAPGAVSGQRAIRWYEAGGAVLAIGALTLLDDPVQRWAQTERSSASDGLAGVFRHVGQPEVYVPVTLGLVATGVVTGERRFTNAGLRAMASLGVSAATELTIKPLLGRARPFSGVGPYHFRPFHGSYAMPSGHTTLAFALAASLADEVRSPVVKVALYATATGTALSRVNDDRHWVSDVAAGALIGITSAKLVNGRWRVFGLRPPHVLIAGGRQAIMWSIDF
jgi:membrane-associated phospholipid phosphatase